MVLVRRRRISLKFALVVIGAVPIIVLLYYRSIVNEWICSSVQAMKLQSLTANKNESADDQCIRTFLTEYDTLCRNLTYRRPTINDDVTPHEDCSLCPCLPSTLKGEITPSYSITINDSMTDELPGVVGGRWKPSNCVARHRIAIIVPFRDRAEHLRTFLGSFHPLLQRQQLDYTIFVVEQVKPLVFNKAMLMNSGFAEVRKRAHFDCFIFHDVDMIPLDDRNMFTCSKTPRHVAAYVDKWGYRASYYSAFGGAVAFRREHFELVNGFSNIYWGWGGEDDDMFQRTRYAKLTLAPRFPPCVAKYKMFSHGHDVRNPPSQHGHLGLKYRPTDYPTDGLNSLSYTLAGVEERSLFTKFLIELPPAPPPTQEPVRNVTGTTVGSTASRNVTTSGPKRNL